MAKSENKQNTPSIYDAVSIRGADLKDAEEIMTVKPVKPDRYADHLSGDWSTVPDWAVRRINFLEEVIAFNDKARCPLLEIACPDVPELSCGAVKHCYSHLCHGACGHNEIWVSDEEKALLYEAKNRREKFVIR
jgi:hypothetical protein